MEGNNQGWNSETLLIMDIVTASKEVSFLPAFICLLEKNKSQSYEQTLTTPLGNVDNGARNRWGHFGDASDLRKVLKILHHCKTWETFAFLVVPGLLTLQGFLEQAGRYEENSAQHHFMAGRLLWGFRGTSYF